MPETRVLIIADNLLARTGLATLLDGYTQLVVVGQVDIETLDILDIYRPDVIVLDWDHQAITRTSRLPVVILVPDVLAVQEMLPLLDEIPAYGLLLRDDIAADRLAASITAVAEGLISLSPTLMQQMLSTSNQPSPQLIEQLTPREFDVLQCLAQGLQNKSIASKLDISQNTVKFHINAIFSKLNVQSRTEAVVRATQLGLIVL